MEGNETCTFANQMLSQALERSPQVGTELTEASGFLLMDLELILMRRR